MAIKSEVRPAEGYVIRHISGTLSLEEIQAAWDSLLEDQQLYPELNVVWNLLPGTVLSIPADGIQRLVRQMSHYVQGQGRTYRLALVSEDDVNFGAGRMVEGLSASLPITVHVFRSLDEALAWAGEQDT